MAEETFTDDKGGIQAHMQDWMVMEPVQASTNALDVNEDSEINDADVNEEGSENTQNINLERIDIRRKRAACLKSSISIFIFILALSILLKQMTVCIEKYV